MLPLLAVSCSDPPVPLAFVRTLGEQPGSVPLVAHGERGATIGEDRRPASRGALQRPFIREGMPVAVAGGMEQVFRVGPLAVGRRLVVTRLYRTKAGEPARELPSLLIAPTERTVAVPFEAAGLRDPATAQLIADAFLVPAPQQAQEIDAIDARPGAILTGGFGLDPIGRGVATRPVAFKLVAHSDAGPRALVEHVLDPSEAQSHAWTSYEVDLSELAGKRVTIELQSTVQAAAGEDASRAVGFPVWSAPVLLAPQPEALRDARNAILISLDTLRADFVGAYGQKLPTTPNIDRIAAGSTLFEKAFTTYPSTTAAHMSMLTGFMPSVHGVFAPGNELARSIPLLAEILAGRGYRTMAVTENAMVAANSGFPRSFETYREYKTPDTSTHGHVSDVIDDSIAWLREHRGERFFLFLHTYQVHEPFAPPPKCDVFPEASEGPWAPDAKAARRGYAGDVRCTDDAIGRLVAELDALGEADRTVLVITSDHGEMLGEHGLMGHTWYLFEPVLHIPLIVRAPGRMPAGTRVAAPVSLVDVAPTILDLLETVPVPATQGRSLRALAADPTDTLARERVVYTENNGGKAFAFRKGNVKWLSTPGTFVRYDLERDPAEDAGSTDPAGLREGRELGLAYHHQLERVSSALGGVTPRAAPVDEATRQKLQALGYTD
jgi:arylsulfatase A-like enzyme